MKAPARSADRPSDQTPPRRTHSAKQSTRPGDGVGIESTPKALDDLSGNRPLALREVMASSPTFTGTLLRYVHVFMVQANHTAIAAGRGKIHERLARGLLMWHDRVRDDQLSVTHDFLALLLGVRRPGVTVAL